MTEPDAARPDAAGPDGAGRDAARPDRAAPDAAGRDAAGRDAGLGALIGRVRERLAGLPTERLGTMRPARRVLGVPRAERILPGDEVWHLGAVLVRRAGPAEDALLSTGEILRAREEVRRGFTAESQRARAAHAAAARRGGFAEGETAHVDAVPVDAGALAATGASGPISVGPGGILLIQWTRGGAPVPFESYLTERIDLLRRA